MSLLYWSGVYEWSRLAPVVLKKDLQEPAVEEFVVGSPEGLVSFAWAQGDGSGIQVEVREGCWRPPSRVKHILCSA